MLCSFEVIVIQDGKGKGKEVTLQWPRGFQEVKVIIIIIIIIILTAIGLAPGGRFMKTAQDGGKVVGTGIGHLYPQDMFLVLISVRGWGDPRAIVRVEGFFYVNEKFRWH